ncbi:MAG: hypothetical protein AAGG51_14065 [Cyanobacteria bacterium P01_G01_bin.54]
MPTLSPQWQASAVPFNALNGFRFDVLGSGNTYYSGLVDPDPLVAAPHLWWRPRNTTPSSSIDTWGEAGIPEQSTETERGADSFSIFKFEQNGSKPYYLLFPKIGEGEFDNPFPALEGFRAIANVTESATPNLQRPSYNAVSSSDFEMLAGTTAFEQQRYTIRQLVNENVLCIERCEADVVVDPPQEVPEGSTLLGIAMVALLLLRGWVRRVGQPS